MVTLQECELIMTRLIYPGLEVNTAQIKFQLILLFLCARLINRPILHFIFVTNYVGVFFQFSQFYQNKQIHLQTYKSQSF